MSVTDFNFDNISVNDQGRVRVSGAGTGIDTVDIVNNIIRARRLPIDRIEDQISDNDDKIDALSQFRLLTQSLQSSLSDLRGTRGGGSSNVFDARETYLSNYRTDARSPSSPANLLSVNVSGNAPLGENEIEIRQVARAQRIASDRFASRNQALGLSGSLRLSGIEVGDTPALPIIIDASDSLNDIRDQINAANTGTNATGVAASIIDISDTEHVLILTAGKSARQIAISGDDTLIGANGLGLVRGGSVSAAKTAFFDPANPGVEAVIFGSREGRNAFQLTYEAARTTLRLTRLYDGVSQAVDISPQLPGLNAGGPGTVIDIGFADFDATVRLNRQFDPGADITLSPSRFAPGGNSGTLNPDSIRLVSAEGDVSRFDFRRLSFDLSQENFDPAAIELVSGAFRATFDGSVVSGNPQQVVFSDGEGNRLTVSLEVTNPFNDQGTPAIALGNHNFSAGGNSGFINSQTIVVTSIEGDVNALNDVDLDFDVSDPSAILVSSGEFSGVFDGTVTGEKTLTLQKDTDNDGIPEGRLTLNFTLESGFDNRGNPTLSLNQHTYSQGENTGNITLNETLKLLNSEGDISVIETKILRFDVSSPNRVEARLGNFSAYFDGSTTGAKVITLEDGNGNALTIQFVLEDALNNQGTPFLELGFLDNTLAAGGNIFQQELQKPQNAQLSIKGLSDPGRYESDLVPDKQAALKSYFSLATETGSFTLTVGGNSVVINYDVNDANNDGTSGDLLTLERLAQNITNALVTAGNVQAKVDIVDTNNGSRLVIESTDPDNPDAPITLDDPNFLLFDLGVDNDLVIARPENTINDLLGGLTLNLLNAEEGTIIRLTTERDPTQAKEAIDGFVKAYNAFKTFINRQEALDPLTGQSAGAPLFANQALRQVKNIANTAIGNGASNQSASLPFRVLAQIGVNFVNNLDVDSDQHDTLEIDEARLNDVLLNDFDGVGRLFGFDFTSSDSRVSFLGLEGVPVYSETGYRLDFQYANGKIDQATIKQAGSDESYSVTVDNNILRVTDGPARGLQLFYGGDGSGPASVTLNFTTGFGQQFYADLQNALAPEVGVIENSIQDLEERNQSANQRINNLDLRIELERERLTRRFERMEEQLTQAKALQESLKQLFDSLRPRDD